jgi:S-DNA-T family DNA segregation ATPase FtsK/SpoIIIE
MAKRKKKKSDRKSTWKNQLSFELFGIGLLAVASISLAKVGNVGITLVYFFRFFLGEWYILLNIGLIVLAGYLMVKRKKPMLLTRRLAGVYIFALAMVLSSHIKLFELLSSQGGWSDPSVIRNTWELFWMEVKGEAATSYSDLGGGMIGALLFAGSFFLFDELGTKMMIVFLILISFILITGKTISGIFSKVMPVLSRFIVDQLKGFREDLGLFIKKLKGWKQSRKPLKDDGELVHNGEDGEVPIVDHQAEAEPIISNFQDIAYQHEAEIKSEETPSPQQVKQQKKSEEEAKEVTVPMAFTEIENEDYQLPSLDLLKPPKQNSQMYERRQISMNVKKLEQTFQSFGVKAKVAKVHLGPAVTKYEVYPDIGVKVSKIVNLTDDLALALAAKDIRIEAPIPGKSAIGIEVPNKEVAMVSLREVLDSKNSRAESKLLFALGRDISGEAVLGELNKMPHLLVAGATGSGKSVCVNGIITSILMRAKPHEVKMMMIDPKMVELNVYNGIPHLLAPVVTDPKKASQALKKVVSEMERRYDLFSHTGTRNIEGYNDYIKRQNAEEGTQQPTLPYIVVLVDELADLMMVASSDVEDCITRLAQMARAAGIHLIIATQRPSVDVITGIIKANIPSRIAFSVSSQTDSRTILDMGGAEKLLGRGDMLFLPVGANKPVRVQGAFLSDAEVEEVVDFVISQQKAQYQDEMIPTEETANDVNVDDELYHDAVQLVVEMQTASVSMLQRRFRVGYTRAARLIDAMEANGVVGPYEGSKPREVLISQISDEASSQ